MRDDEIRQAHNWCDRWCERCSLVSSCPVGRRVRIGAPDAGLVGAGGMMERAATMLEVEVARRGIVIDESALDAWKAEQRAAMVHPLSQSALAWALLANRWLDRRDHGEATEVVGRYLLLIPSKIHRALVGQREWPEDARGSAKVASLAVTRLVESLTDWCAAHPLDSVGMELLLATGDLLQPIERAFPGHLTFRRPGLDPA